MKGIRKWYRAGRPSPWIVTWRANGKSTTKSFAEEADRDWFASTLVKKREQFGTEVLTFDPREWAAYLTFRDATSYLPLDEIRQRLGAVERQGSLTVDEALEKFFAMKKPRISSSSFCHMKKNLGRLQEEFGKTRLRSVTADSLEKWISSLPYAPQTVHSHFRDLRTFFNWASRQEHIVSNPVNKIDPPTVPRETIHFLQPWEGRRLFKANKGLPVVGRLACEAFVGVRFSAAAQIRAEHINRDDKGLTLWSKNDGGTRYIEGFPDTVWKWIENAPEEAWTMNPHTYMTEKSKAFVRAGINNEGNALRHSFCTYHSMLEKDLQLTATIAQNSVAMLDKHYRGKATSAQAKEWFSIVPQQQADQPIA